MATASALAERQPMLIDQAIIAVKKRVRVVNLLDGANGRRLCFDVVGELGMVNILIIDGRIIVDQNAGKRLPKTISDLGQNQNFD
jgi:hypothetical protein